MGLWGKRFRPGPYPALDLRVAIALVAHMAVLLPASPLVVPAANLVAAECWSGIWLVLWDSVPWPGREVREESKNGTVQIARACRFAVVVKTTVGAA